MSEEFINEELEKNRNVLKVLQDIIVHMKSADDNIRDSDRTQVLIFDDIIELLEEAVVRISRLEKGLAWSIETIEMVQYVLISEVAKYDRSKENSDELKWVKSLLEKNDDNDNSS